LNVLKNSAPFVLKNRRDGESGEKLFPAADQLGLEGVIGKKANSPYPRGRTPLWVKVKTRHGRHIDEERAKWNE
jgi:ATP-dependent DNA ligase